MSKHQHTATVLITGTTGYVGRFLIAFLIEKTTHNVAFVLRDREVGDQFLQRARQLIAPGRHVTPLYFDLVEGSAADLVNLLASESIVPDVCVNCSGWSMPAQCEPNPEMAIAANTPRVLVEALPSSCALIHMSTDHVYDGEHPVYTESSPNTPVNAYGRSKLVGETHVLSTRGSHSVTVVLRSSIVIGPTANVRRTLFVQFMDNVLANKIKSNFFEDEIRTPVFIFDLLMTISAIIDNRESFPSGVYNCGGPERVSRVDMAEQLCAFRGYDTASIVPVRGDSVKRPVPVPADVSMDSSRLWSAVGQTFLSFRDCLPVMLGNAPHSFKVTPW